MNVSLTPQLEELINRKVASGRYNSASEVVREALRLFEDRELIRETRLEELRREIALGLEDLEHGRTSIFDPEKVKAEGRKRLARLRDS